MAKEKTQWVLRRNNPVQGFRWWNGKRWGARSEAVLYPSPKKATLARGNEVGTPYGIQIIDTKNEGWK